MRPSLSAVPFPRTSDVAAMAPVLTIELNGRFVRSSNRMALNESPEGSTPILDKTASRPRSCKARTYTNGLEIDWIVKGLLESPTS